MRIYVMLVLLAIGSTTLAVEKATAASEIPSKVTKTLKYVQKLVKKPGEPTSIRLSPITGLYEAEIGSMVFYISADGEQFVIGSIYEANGIAPKNLTDQKRTKLRIDTINTLGESEMVVFAPETETKHTVNVFTDVDCGFCAKFHREVPALNKLGVKVRYLAFPRAGVGSKTYKTMVSVWCSEDKQKAMTDAKNGREVKKAKCSNPIEKHYNIGQQIGINGTPAMVLSDGELVPGYMPANKLFIKLEQKAASK